MQSYAEFMSSGKRTLHEIIAWKKANKMEVFEERKFSPSANERYAVAAKPMVFPSKLSDGSDLNPSNEEVKKLLASIAGFEFLESIRTVNAAGKEAIATNQSQLYTVGALNNIAGTMIGTCMAKKGVEGTEEDFKLVTSEINDYYYGGGTVRGLFRRIQEQMGERGKKFPETPVGVEEASYINTVLPVDFSGLANLVGMSPGEVNPKMNHMAHAGAPWFDPKIRVSHKAEEILTGATNLYNLAAEGYDKVKEYLQKTKRDEGVVLLKNKRELSKRKNAYSKVRPYYVYPGALRYLFACITESYSMAQLNAFENEKSISAFRFSWMYGGAVKLASWIATRRMLGVGFYALSWGDDQLWVIVCRDGSICYTAPDVMGMDMNLGVETMKFTTKKMISDYGRKIDEVWKRLVVLFGQYTHNHPVLAYHGLVVYKSGRSLSSGVNATTVQDFTGSARITYRAKPLLEDCEGMEAVAAKMSEVNRKIKAELGMEFKPETMVVAKFDEESMEIELPFLGMTTQNVEIDGMAALVPIPDIPKLSASLFYSKYSKNDAEQVSALLSKCVGICASGGYTNKLLYHVCRRVYNFYADKAVPKANFEWMGEMPDELIEYLDHSKVSAAKEFPTRRWFMRLYLQPDSAEAEEAQQERISGGLVGNSRRKGSIGGMTEEELELLEIAPSESKTWAEVDFSSGKAATGAPVDVDKAKPVVGIKVDKLKAGLMPPDYARRIYKAEQCRLRSEARYRARREFYEQFKRDMMERKYSEDEMEIDEGLRFLSIADDITKDAAERAVENAMEEWRQQEILMDQLMKEANLKYEFESDEDVFDELPLTKEEKLKLEYGDSEYDEKYDQGGYGGYGGAT